MISSNWTKENLFNLFITIPHIYEFVKLLTYQKILSKSMKWNALF
jgi:hypothetical protein